MEDRIAALESKVAELQLGMAEAYARYFCLKRSFWGICGRLALPMINELHEGKEECNVSALWLTIPGVTAVQSDRLTDLIRNEFDDLYAGLIAVAEARQAEISATEQSRALGD